MKKILGVGTALVDVICQVEDSVINNLKLTKGSMTLIEESQIKEIRSNFDNPLITSGGSVCNTIHELTLALMRQVFTARSMMMSMEMLLFKIYKKKISRLKVSPIKQIFQLAAVIF